MKKVIFYILSIITFIGFIATSKAQSSIARPNEANAQVLSAIGLTATQSLEFGGIIPAASTAGTVVMNTSDVRSAIDVTLVSSSVTPKSAAYTVGGTGLVSYTITLSTAPFNLTNTTGSGNETMAVSDITCSKGTLVNGSIVSAFDASGADFFSVGGTLHVAQAANQTPGYYTGTLIVTVAY